MNKIQRVWIILRRDGFMTLMKRVNKCTREKLPYRKNFFAAVIYFLLRGSVLTRYNEFYQLRDIRSGKVWLLPGLRATYHTLESYQDRITKQFFNNEHIQIDEEDTVFEVGSYIGGSTIGVAEIATQVYAIEPSPRNFECLKHNVEELENVEVINTAAWNRTDTVEIRYGTAADDDSLLTPDKGDLQKTSNVPADTIANIANEMGVNHIDFLKVEAEGVEPEVIEGASGIHIDKIAVDCGPERDGEPVTDEIKNQLLKRGYNIMIGGKMLYAQKNQ